MARAIRYCHFRVASCHVMSAFIVVVSVLVDMSVLAVVMSAFAKTVSYKQQNQSIVLQLAETILGDLHKI